VLAPVETLDGFGHLQHAPPNAGRFPARRSRRQKPSPRHPPGFYGTADARIALNLSTAINEMSRSANCLPEWRPKASRKTPRSTSGGAVTAAFLLLLLDLLIAYALRGLLRRRRPELPPELRSR